jgi:septal ring factor EnvC (AmiA/AmiB activator)
MDLMTDTAPDLATLEKKVDVGFTRVSGAFAVVDERFKQIDERFKQVEERFKRVDERFNRVDDALAAIKEDSAKAEARSIRFERTMKEGFDRSDDRFERLYARFLMIGAGLTGTLVAAIGTVIVTHL